MAEEYITYHSEEIKGRITNKLSHEFSWTDSCIFSALSENDNFLLNPRVRTFCAAVTGTSRNNNSENQEPAGDRSLDDTYPEVESSACQTSTRNDSDPEETSHMLTGVEKEIT